jgi:ribosomal-protein-alanine N-acetyltransferase
MSDPDVTEFLTWDTHSAEYVTACYITSVLREYTVGSLDWCITLRKDNIPIGNIAAAQDYPELRYCELGYSLSKEFWNRGIMTEALRAVCAWIFDHTDYLWVQARHDSENEASGRCMEKAGMVKVTEFDDMFSKKQIMRHYVMRRIYRPGFTPSSSEE